MKMTEDTLQVILSISELSFLNSPLAGKQWNEEIGEWKQYRKIQRMRWGGGIKQQGTACLLFVEDSKRTVHAIQ